MDDSDIDTNDNASSGGAKVMFQNKSLGNFNPGKCLQETGITAKVCKELS